MGDGIICQVCGIEAPVKHVAFNQNIGMLVARRRARIEGDLCKRCVHAQYWKKTGTTLAVGWLGQISIFVAPVFIIGNTISYVSSLGMKSVPRDARRPALDQAARDKLAPLFDELVERINNGEPVGPVARELAPRAGVTPGQVVLYVRWMAEWMRQQQQPQQPTYGFPVVPAATAQRVAPRA